MQRQRNEKKAKEDEKLNEGTFECEDGTMVFDSPTVLQDRVPGQREKLLRLRKLRKRFEKKAKEESDKANGGNDISNRCQERT